MLLATASAVLSGCQGEQPSTRIIRGPGATVSAAETPVTSVALGYTISLQTGRAIVTARTADGRYEELDVGAVITPSSVSHVPQESLVAQRTLSPSPLSPSARSPSARSPSPLSEHLMSPEALPQNVLPGKIPQRDAPG